MIVRIASMALFCASQPAFAQDYLIDLDGEFSLDVRTITYDEIGPKAWVRSPQLTSEGIFYVEIEMQAVCDVPVVASYQMVMWSDYSDRVIQREIDSDAMFASPDQGGLKLAFFEYFCR